MGREAMLVCHDCSEQLWVGQWHFASNTKTMRLEGYMYFTQDACLSLDDFMFRHQHHRLEFGDSESKDNSWCDYKIRRRV